MFQSATSACPAPGLYRVLHVLFSPRMAGSERYCVDLANRQAALGHEVHVAGRPGSPLAAALSSQVSFHAMPLPMLRRLRVRRLVNKLGIDICHGHLSAACKSLAYAPLQAGTVATLHVGYKAHQHVHMDGLICVNHAQMGRLAAYAGQAKVISNWLPAPLPTTGRRNVRAELGLPEDAFVVGAVGRLDASKGMDVLISAFRDSAPDYAELVILGEGSQRGLLEKLRAGDRRIHLLGHRHDVADCMQQFDLFVSPSREESFGLAIVEAMSAGLPLISTATEGPSEILRGHPARMVAPGSVQELSAALAEALDRLSEQPGARVAYDLRCFEHSHGVAEVSAFYAQVLDARHRSNSSPLPPSFQQQLHRA